MAGVSFGARMAGRGAQMAESVAGMGRKISARGLGMKMDARSKIMAGDGNPFGQALRHKGGHNLMRAGQFVENRPKTSMGIASGVTGAGLMASNRRRGSQNYPIE